MPKSKQRKKALKAKNIQAKRLAKWKREQDGMPPVLSPHCGDGSLFVEGPISPELEQKIEGILHAVRKDKPLSQVQQAARDAGLELHVKIEKAPIVADVVADQVTDNTEAVQAAVDEAAMSGAFNRAVLATKTKSDLLILAANRDVNVFKSWTNERIIDAIMASA
jgi:hypothetical protein